ncbi:hypothetical protein [Photobacterium leiognathi]|uniref:hypothetical protein n=1 Tax=Photobacterium leiognathi TaxID=553611 RepID=UPI0029825224|nr:hypothetical protein [Photobacterium leiognathi]
MKIFFYLLVALLVASPIQAATNIASCDDLVSIPDRSNASWVLVNDIDCQGYQIPTNKTFFGHLNGDGHAIRHLTIVGNEPLGYPGLFKKMVNASVSNIVFEDAILFVGELDRYVKYAGLIAATMTDSKLENVTLVNSSISVDSVEYGVGSLIGHVYKSTVSGVSVENTQIQMTDYARSLGGVFGQVISSKLNAITVKGNSVDMMHFYDRDNAFGLLSSQLHDVLLDGVLVVDNFVNEKDLFYSLKLFQKVYAGIVTARLQGENNLTDLVLLSNVHNGSLYPLADYIQKGNRDVNVVRDLVTDEPLPLYPQKHDGKILFLD